MNHPDDFKRVQGGKKHLPTKKKESPGGRKEYLLFTGRRRFGRGGSLHQKKTPPPQKEPFCPQSGSPRGGTPSSRRDFNRARQEEGRRRLAREPTDPRKERNDLYRGKKTRSRPRKGREEARRPPGGEKKIYLRSPKEEGRKISLSD